jgi:RNA polymerase sigma-19 factor, ECF subfamily
MALRAHNRPTEEGARSADPSALAEDWVARIRAGDEAAFEAMFRVYYDPLCRYVAPYVGSRDAAEDIVQGVFTRIWEDRAGWAVSDLGHYLYTAVRRRATSQFRHAAVRRRAAPLLTLGGVGVGSGAPAVDAELEADELRRRLERALADLPPRTRAAFELSRRHGLSYDEVALRMSISPKTVGVHIGRARAVLRKAISPLQ